MKNQQIAQLFERAADTMAVKGENSFRILAFRKITRALEELHTDVEKLLADGTLGDVPGIGESSVTRIAEFLRSGKIAEFEDLFAEIPAGVMKIMHIPTVGPKTAALLWQEGGVTTLEALQTKLAEKDFGGLATLPGLGAKKLEKIKQNIAFLSTSSGRVRLGQALPVAETFVEFLQSLPGVQQAQYCGSLRRAKETIGDIDIALAAEDVFRQAISDAVTKHPFTSEILGAGLTKTSIRTAAGMQIDVRVVPPDSFGAALQYFTGSKEHNVKLRELAIKKDLKLNEWGLFQGEKNIASKTEVDIYAALDMACLPPEMREDKGEIELARQMWQAAKSPTGGGAKPPAAKTKKKSPTAEDAPSAPVPATWQVLELTDIRGDLHMHTAASDGSKSIAEMVAECKRRGLGYCAITDHSKSQFQANGLRSDRLLDHVAAIHAVAKEVKGILVLAGSEVDILADGSLDYEDEVLAKLDWVVASPHAALTQESDPATTRLVRVAANPFVHVIGHPTGRLVPGRRGLEPDMAKVVFAAARSGIALELNANTHRLDLRDIHLKMARDAGVPVCIDTDAHDFTDFDQLRYGILTARRGWLQKTNVLNTLPLEAFQKWLKARKDQSAW